MASELLCVPHGCFLTQKAKRSSLSTLPHPLSSRTAPSTLFKVRCSSGKTNISTTSTSDRLSANYQPTSWSYDYLQSLNVNHHVSFYHHISLLLLFLSFLKRKIKEHFMFYLLIIITIHTHTHTHTHTHAF